MLYFNENHKKSVTNISVLGIASLRFVANTANTIDNQITSFVCAEGEK